MAKIKGLFKWIFKLTPARISIIIMILFLFLYTKKEQASYALDHYFDHPYSSLVLIESKAYDIRFQLTDTLWPSEESDQIVIADIDDRAVAYYTWPFPRDLWADFIRRMDEYGASVVAFDVIWTDPGKYLGLEFVGDVMERYESLGLDDPPEIRSDRNGELSMYFKKAHSFDEFLETKQKEADRDLVLANALSEVDNVTLGWYGILSQSEVEEHADKDFSDNAALLERSVLSIRLTKGWDYPKLTKRMDLVRFRGLQTPVPVIADKADSFGFFTATPDTVDGTIRRTPLLGVFTGARAGEEVTYENTYVFPSLALEALAVHFGVDPAVKFDELGANISLANKVIPTDRFGRLLINWMGPRETFPYYSIYDIITGFEDVPEVEDPKSLFEGKIVLVGSSSTGAHDLRTTPFGTSPGVEMHANVASNILQGNGLIKPEWFVIFDYLFIIGVGLVFALVLPRLSAIVGGVVTLLIFSGYLGMNLYFFVVQHYAFSLVFPLTEVLFIYIGITIFRYATEEREKRFIKGAFEHYLSPTVIHQLMNDPSKLKLGGERKELTAFFSDIQSFSTFSEQMEPEELVHFLNIYLTEMCDIILEHDGTIDKFEGDAIIAFFGAPLDFANHAEKASLALVDIQTRMVALRESWKEEGWPEVHMRIGLNTGPMVVGNMGSRDRMDYTIMGDAVNLAARLEEAAKQYKIYSMISEYTYEEAKNVIDVRELDLTRVVGKTEPVKVYEVIGKKGEVPADKMDAARLFEEGLRLYRGQQWDLAIEKFEQANAASPPDGPSKVFIERCKEYTVNPPPPEWDGVYVMTKK